MNFLHCHFDPARGSLVGGTFEYAIGGKWTDILEARKPGELILGIRPEDMSVSTSPSPRAIRATVYVIEQLGREILLNAKIGEEMVRAFAAADAQLGAEQDVWLTFNELAIHLFDGETERSLSSRYND